MNGSTVVSAIALLMCAILVAAGLQHRGGWRANARSAMIWAAIIIGLAVAITALGWT